jgi:DNA-binding MarR family transcriptional regulator
MGPVASLLAMDRTTLTAALKPLERRGLVKVLRDQSDRRTRILKLTDNGRNLLARALPLWKRTHDEVEQLVPDRDSVIESSDKRNTWKRAFARRRLA